MCKIVKGTTGIASAKSGEYPLVVTAVERKTCSDYQFDCEAVCIPLVSSSGHGKKSLNNVHYQSGKFALGTILCAVIPNDPKELDARYLHQYLQFYKDTVLVPLMKGAANVSLSMKDIASVEIPLPPIGRQRELSAMFVSLQEKSRQLRVESEKQIEYAKQLRASILQDAIEGKLTADWREKHPVEKGDPDYDAEALIEKIQLEKQEKNKKQKPLPAITEEEKPFVIPYGWMWGRLGDVIYKITDGTHRTPKYTKSGIPFLSVKDLSSGIIDFTNTKFISIEEHKELFKRCNPEKGDILLTKVGTTGIPVLNESEKEFSLFVSVALLKFNNFYFNKYFFVYLLRSPLVQKQAKENTKGMGNKNWVIDSIVNTLLAIPPLAEQKEIVARVEKHLQTITQLDTQIATRETLTKQLMQGLLKDAFEED